MAQALARFQFQQVRLQSSTALVALADALISIPTGAITVPNSVDVIWSKKYFNSNRCDYSSRMRIFWPRGSSISIPTGAITVGAMAGHGISYTVFQFQQVRLQFGLPDVHGVACRVSIPTGAITVLRAGCLNHRRLHVSIPTGAITVCEVEKEVAQRTKFQFQQVRLQSVSAGLTRHQQAVSIPTGAITVTAPPPTFVAEMRFNSNRCDYSRRTR